MRCGRLRANPAFILLLCLLVGGCAGQRAADPTVAPSHSVDGLVTQVEGPDGTVSIPASIGSWFEAAGKYTLVFTSG